MSATPIAGRPNSGAGSRHWLRSAHEGAAPEAVAELPADLSTPIVDRILRDHPDADVAHQAVESLGELPEAQALPLLIRTAQEHPRAEMREEARERLGDP